MPLPTEIPSWAWPVAGAIAVLALLVWIFLKIQAYRHRRAIDATIASVGYEMLKNVLLPNGNGGQIHVNYVLLTQRGVLVADLLDLPGAVFGGEQMLEWTAIGKKRRYTFANPQHALYDRMAAVKLLIGDVPVEGRVIFTLPNGETVELDTPGSAIEFFADGSTSRPFSWRGRYEASLRSAAFPLFGSPFADYPWFEGAYDADDITNRTDDLGAPSDNGG